MSFRSTWPSPMSLVPTDPSMIFWPLTEAFLSFPLVTAWAARSSVFTLSFLIDFELTEFGGAMVTEAYAPVLIATRRANRATIMAGDGRSRCIETLLALFHIIASVE